MPSRSKAAWLIAGTIVLSLGVYLIGNNSVALFDRDEPRYAECSREMLMGSPEHPGPDFVVPRFLGDLRTAKPPGIYWLQAAAMKGLGDTVFAARLPSAIGMVLTLILFSIAIWKLAGPSRAAWATLILASSVMTIVSAKACLTDAVLLLFITAAHLCLYATYRGRGGWGVMILWCVCIGLAGLTKGPVILAVQAVTILVLGVMHVFTGLRRRFGPKQPNLPPRGFAVVTADEPQVALPDNPAPPRAPVVTYAARGTRIMEVDVEARFLSTVCQLALGIAIVAGIVGPWLWAINKAAPDFLPTVLGHDVVSRMKNGLEGHSAPPGYHLVTIWGMFFPWSIFLPMMLISAFKRRHLPIIRFALATMLGNFIFFELVKTKLPHYLLPIYPWMALMTADAIVPCLRGLRNDLVNGLARFALTIWGAIVILLGLLPWLFLAIFRPIPIGPTLAFTAVAAVVGTAIIYTFRTRKPRAGLLVMGLGNFAFVAVVFGVYLPHVDFLRTPVLAGAELRRMNLTEPGSVQMLDYKEPSLAFYQGGTIRENSNNVLTARLIDNPKTPAYLVITDFVWNKSDPAVQARYEVLKEYPTLAYADSMRRIKVMIVHRKD